jgi:hypothetical protein
MNRQQDEALEAAKLAAMVGSHLRSMDQMTVESMEMPANRINLNKFIDNVRQHDPRRNNAPRQNFAYNNGPSPYPSEAQVRAMVPDAPSFVPPQPSLNDLTAQMIPLPSAPTMQQSPVTNESLKNIEQNVEKIGNTLETLLELVNKITIQQSEQ